MPHRGAAESSRGQGAREEVNDASAPTPRRSTRCPRPRLAAAALAAANGAAEDDSNTRKAPGGSRKGGKGKAKAKQDGVEELFPDEGEEDNGDDD